jgi:hypothetical protein
MSTPDRDIRRRPDAEQPGDAPDGPTDDHDEPTELPDRDAMSILSPSFGSDFAPYPGMPVDTDE